MRFVRYEILLPLKYNDGTAVEAIKFEETREELLQRFEAVSQEPAGIQGMWIHQQVRFEDELIRIFVDCEDTKIHREFFRTFKRLLKTRFGQLDIWITAHSIRVI